MNPLPAIKNSSDDMTDKTIYYPYNETFKFYGFPKAGKRAQKFIDEQNKCKGGNWVLHTKEQYAEWFEKKGRFIRDMEVSGISVPKFSREF